MSVHLSKQQLDRLAEGSTDAVVVRDSATKQKFVVVTEAAYRRARSVLALMSTEIDVGDSAKSAHEDETWTEADNDRRIALIDKKYRRRLTKEEQKELQQLQQRAYRRRQHVAPVRNEVRKLLLEALEQRAQSAK